MLRGEGMSTDVLMRRIIAVITCLIAVAGVLCGCNIFDNRTYHWEFEQEYSAAKEILIVDVSCDDGIYREELLKNLSLESAKEVMDLVNNFDPLKAQSSVYSNGGARFLVDGHHTTVASAILGRGTCVNMGTVTSQLPSVTNVYWAKKWYQIGRIAIKVVE